jgi:ABC-type multidrug transport system fused ATPase/permease subunit
LNRSAALLLELVRGRRRLLVRFAAASLGRAALTALTILLVRDFLAGVLGEGTGLAGSIAARVGGPGVIWVAAMLLLVTHLGASLLNYDASLTQQRLVATLELGTMERLIRHLLGLSARFFDRHTQGDLIQTVRQDVSHLRQVGQSAAHFGLDAVQAAGLLTAAVWLSPALALWAFVLLPLAAMPIIWLARRTLATSFGVRRKGVWLFDTLLQLLRGVRVIKVYQGEASAAAATIDRARGYFDEVLGMERSRAMARVALEWLSGLSLVLVIVAGGFQVMAGTITWPELLAFFMAARAVQSPLGNMNSAYVDIQRYGASVERIDRLLAERSDVREDPAAQPLDRDPRIISFDGVGFRYGTRLVLDDVSFEVAAGETLGVVGPSGAGKTTLLSLVARFYDPDAGSVRFDGVDLRQLRLADVYARLAIVTQDPFLFDGTIRENIRAGRPAASDLEVEDAARAAEIHDEISRMPDGYSTLVGQGGRPLSRGEAQRLNVARAILKNAPILLLDEATSSLDSVAEAKVQRAIDRLVAGRTVISVAHRLSTLRNANRILMLDRGRVEGLATHDELLRRVPGYRRLWEAQTRSPHDPDALAAGTGAREVVNG